MFLPLKYKDGWTSGPRPEKRDDVAMLQAMFGLDYGTEQGLYGSKTAADIGAKLGIGEVMEVDYKIMQLAANKGIFAGAGAAIDAYTKGEADARFVNIGETVRLAK